MLCRFRLTSSSTSAYFSFLLFYYILLLYYYSFKNNNYSLPDQSFMFLSTIVYLFRNSLKYAK